MLELTPENPIQYTPKNTQSAQEIVTLLTAPLLQPMPNTSDYSAGKIYQLWPHPCHFASIRVGKMFRASTDARRILQIINCVRSG
jgi:hypothetical protein